MTLRRLQELGGKVKYSGQILFMPFFCSPSFSHRLEQVAEAVGFTLLSCSSISTLTYNARAQANGPFVWLARGRTGMESGSSCHIFAPTRASFSTQAQQCSVPDRCPFGQTWIFSPTSGTVAASFTVGSAPMTLLTTSSKSRSGIVALGEENPEDRGPIDKRAGVVGNATQPATSVPIHSLPRTFLSETNVLTASLLSAHGDKER